MAKRKRESRPDLYAKWIKEGYGQGIVDLKNKLELCNSVWNFIKQNEFLKNSLYLITAA